MAVVELKKEIFWVGVIDWNLRDFHGYSTERGTTYNAYLILDEKITLIDTVKTPFLQAFYHQVTRVLGDRKVDYLVVNHVEMDHSGSLPQVIERFKPEKVFCSPKGREAILEHFHREDFPLEVVKTGDEVPIGKRRLRFIETRMLHWPDSMFTYLPEEGVLFSSDAFGQHWATSQRFDDQVPQGELMYQAAKYYANILWPYSNLVQRLLEDVKGMGLRVEMIAPDHGLIWRGDPGKVLEAYSRWGKQETSPKAVVVYDTMWGSTEQMALSVAEGLMKEGVEVSVFSLKVSHRSDVIAEMLDAKGLFVGSPTLNNGMLPTVADFLHYLKGLKPRGRVGTAFGSYGWSGEAVKLMEAELQATKVELVHEGLRVKYVPDHEELGLCLRMGRESAQAIKG